MAAETTSTKAVVAAAAATVLAFLGSLQVALTSDNVVTGSEWVTVAIATVAAVGGVFGFTYTAPANKPKG
jgi:hypothetical protein